ncbi:phosphoglycerate mutase [Pullulanibacillus camelliae]|uniref:Phosphoglycerate mutase n=1 Tax=Pullulanibacillus camelliae TaxID=1707096 RepID=A0A8J2VN95_9BACL|nr:histidine phosphatase family protein [Pullulanibacillus camelliae]GGE39779.1 phosphoglycerate mutase [Pullulanibacillus camelliae]
MKKLYLIRHCEASGQAPEALLTDKGRLQSESLSMFLSNLSIEQIVCSPFLRAKQSIQPFAQKEKFPVRVDERLRERVLSNEKLSDWYIALKQTYEDVDLKYTGGESTREAMHRAIECIDGCLQEAQSVTVLVTHGGLLSLILKYYDDNYSFTDWEGLTNPDVFCLTFVHYAETQTPKIERIWGQSDGTIP